MNKINNKGFMMAEIIVVAVVIVIALVGLFTTFTRTFIEYERLNEYSQVDSLYASKSVINTLYSDIDSAKDALEQAEEDDLINKPKFIKHDKTTDSKLEPLFDKYNIKTFYLVKYSDEGFNSLIGSLTNNEELKRYVNYLKNNLNLTDGSCEVISILEMQSDSSSNKNQFGYYKFVKTTTGGEECVTEGIWLDDALPSDGSTAPDLTTGLIPVVYDAESKTSTGWFVANTKCKWYDYDEQMWANAVAVDSSTTEKREKYVKDGNYQKGVEIAQEDLLAMFVWIPRYRYSIGCGSILLGSMFGKPCFGQRIKGNNESSSDLSYTYPGAINIEFVSVSETDTVFGTWDFPTYYYQYDTLEKSDEEWYIHPAFNFGLPVSGMWIGKFETTGNSSFPTILPNKISLHEQTLSDQFDISKKFSLPNNDYGLSGDAHMMKNSEWGAVAYLSQSKYGKHGNQAYSNGNKEIFKNDSSDFITGMSLGAPAKSYNEFKPTGTYQYNVDYNGTGASTTGNINGIYDMVGGAAEYVMGFDDESKENVKFIPTDDKYYDKVSSSNGIDYKWTRTGHATSETSSWYSDAGFDPSDSMPWFIRGDDYLSNYQAGIFAFRGQINENSNNNSFRVTLINPS